MPKKKFTYVTDVTDVADVTMSLLYICHIWDCGIRHIASGPLKPLLDVHTHTLSLSLSLSCMYTSAHPCEFVNTFTYVTSYITAPLEWEFVQVEEEAETDAF